MTMIIDGTGTGSRAKVAPNSRLYVNSLSISEFEEASNDGRAFNLNTEDIQVGAITGDQGLLYVENNEDQNLELVGWFIGIRDADRASATSDTNLFKLITNPTGGTLITEAESAFLANRNLGSPRTFDITAYKAAGGGRTITGGGDVAVLYQYHTAGRTFGTVTLSLPKGSSLAITVNTFGADFNLYTGFTGYIRSEDE